MKKLPPRQSIAEQVYQAILDEVCNGALAPGTHLVQEDLARKLGVSRQPVQQAMAMLKADGVVEESGTRGLHVTALDLATMQHRYAIRAVLDGLAAEAAAQAGDARIALRGRQLVAEGREAVAMRDIRALVAADVGFHRYLYDASGNPLLAPTAEPHWRFLRRVMADVLRHAEAPGDIWDQHAAIVEAIAAGNADEAGRLARNHVMTAAERLSRASEHMTAAAAA